MIVNISPETEKRLTEAAKQVGARVADYAGFLIEQNLSEKISVNGANDVSHQLKHIKDEDPDALVKAMARLQNRTSEEIEQTRARIFQEMAPPRPLPEGKTLRDVIGGQWPGDETDEEVLEALKRLS